MKILIADRDKLSAQRLKTALDASGRPADVEEDKNRAVERLAAGRYDVILLDPAPLTSARPVILNIRRSVRNYPYAILLSAEDKSRDEAIKAGANDVLHKPVDPESLETVLSNAARLTRLMRHIGDDSEDFPSAGGVIAKSAFNQLFLAAIDRADRYGERTYVLFITMSNYEEIMQLDGRYAADYAVAKLCQYLVNLRRQSDIAGQTGKNEYALLLQRPIYETEPVEAAARFAEAFGRCEIDDPAVHFPVEVSLNLVNLPTGAKIAEHTVKVKTRAS